MDTDTIIRHLEYEADKHKNDRCFTGWTDITALCRGLIPKMKELKRYEDLEQDGRLLELPCKVGDTVYILAGRSGNFYEEDICDGFFMGRDGVLQIKVLCYKGNHGTYGVLNETVFLTKEAAEDALKEMEGKV